MNDLVVQDFDETSVSGDSFIDVKCEKLIHLATTLNRLDEDFSIMQYDYTTLLNYFRQLKMRGDITDAEFDELTTYREHRIYIRAVKDYERIKKELEM